MRPPDLLLELLQRYEAERAAFDRDVSGKIPDREWDRLADETGSRIQDQILKQQPSATTAAGALLALDPSCETRVCLGSEKNPLTCKCYGS